MAVDFSGSNTTPKPKAAPKPKTVPKEQQDTRDRRSATLKNLGETAQVYTLFKGWYADTATLDVHVPKIADNAAVLAESNPWVARGIDILDFLGPVFGLADVCMPMVLQLAANHKKVPVEPLAMFGVMPVDALESIAKAKLARMSLEALKLQRAAERELEQVRMELESDPELLASFEQVVA